MKENTKDIVDFLNKGIKDGTLIAKVGEDNEIIINNGQPNKCGVDIILTNKYAGGTWSVQDWQ